MTIPRETAAVIDSVHGPAQTNREYVRGRMNHEIERMAQKNSFIVRLCAAAIRHSRQTAIERSAELESSETKNRYIQ